MVDQYTSYVQNPEDQEKPESYVSVDGSAWYKSASPLPVHEREGHTYGSAGQILFFLAACTPVINTTTAKMSQRIDKIGPEVDFGDMFGSVFLLATTFPAMSATIVSQFYTDQMDDDARGVYVRCQVECCAQSRSGSVISTSTPCETKKGRLTLTLPAQYTTQNTPSSRGKPRAPLRPFPFCWNRPRWLIAKHSWAWEGRQTWREHVHGGCVPTDRLTAIATCFASLTHPRASRKSHSLIYRHH